MTRLNYYKFLFEIIYKFEEIRGKNIFVSWLAAPQLYMVHPTLF